MSEDKNVNVDFLGIGSLSKSGVNFIIFIIILVVALIIAGIAGLIFGVGNLLVPGVSEMNGDMISGHTVRFTIYILAMLLSVLGANIAGWSPISRIVIFLVLGVIVGQIVDPAVNRGYDIYVVTQNNGKYHVKNAKFYRGTERIEGFNFYSDDSKHHFYMGKVNWIRIHRWSTTDEKGF